MFYLSSVFSEFEDVPCQDVSSVFFPSLKFFFPILMFFSCPGFLSPAVFRAMLSCGISRSFGAFSPLAPHPRGPLEVSAVRVRTLLFLYLGGGVCGVVIVPSTLFFLIAAGLGND